METIRRLAAAGIAVGVSIGPVIPFINDHEMEALLGASREAGARTAFYTIIRLPLEVNPLFQQWLQAHFPDRASRVMHRIQDMRDGRNNDPRFFSRMKGEGVLAQLIRMRFANTARKLGLDRDEFELRTDLFCKPMPLTDDTGSTGAVGPPEQLTLI
jgi:DNA repair photolyase